MPVILLFFGVLIGMAAMNDKLDTLGKIIKETVYPNDGHGFIIWAGAIVILASLLRVLNLPEAGMALIALVIVAYFLGHKDIPGQIFK